MGHREIYRRGEFKVAGGHRDRVIERQSRLVVTEGHRHRTIRCPRPREVIEVARRSYAGHLGRTIGSQDHLSVL